MYAQVALTYYEYIFVQDIRCGHITTEQVFGSMLSYHKRNKKQIPQTQQWSKPSTREVNKITLYAYQRLLFHHREST